MGKYLIIILLLFNITSCSNGNDNEINISPAPTIVDPERQADRNEMVDNTIVVRGVKDPNVIRAMRTVKRHEFVPKSLQYLAYIDDPCRLGKIKPYHNHILLR